MNHKTNRKNEKTWSKIKLALFFAFMIGAIVALFICELIVEYNSWLLKGVPQMMIQFIRLLSWEV